MEGKETKVGTDIEKKSIRNNPDRFKNININEKSIKEIATTDIDKVASFFKRCGCFIYFIFMLKHQKRKEN